MATDYSRTRKKPVFRMLAFGICSTALYALIFSYQGLITAYFTRGALYAALPIATAFAISFIHGNFTSYFWSVLGVEATKKSVRTRVVEEKHVDRERPQPQPRLRARL